MYDVCDPGCDFVMLDNMLVSPNRICVVLDRVFAIWDMGFGEVV